MSGDTSANLHFYSNACYVCKRYGEGVRLERCKYCNMIAYCSEKHMLAHYPTHVELCSAIKDITAANEIEILKKNPNVPLDDYAWMRLKMKFMEQVCQLTNYSLTSYEKEMFLFPRSCMGCHRQADLYDCPKCPSASFCAKNRNKSHKCVDLGLKLTIDTAQAEVSADFSYINHIDIEKQVFKLPGKDGMVNFFNTFILPRLETQVAQSERPLAIYSQQLTRPLTLLYGAQRVGYKFSQSLIIHVIGSNHMEMESLQTWEILLHLVPVLTYLKVMFFGPEMTRNFPADSELVVCEQCKLLGKKVKFEGYQKRYDIMKIKRPDLIAGFNTKINKGAGEYMDIHPYAHYTAATVSPWKSTIKEISKLKRTCPFILTCYDDFEARYDMMAINNILGSKQPPILVKVNPYRSFRPYRDPETEQVIYQNSYLIVYTSLSSLLGE